MRIGELAELTSTSRRLLRYYEEQGLIVPARCANGFRHYDVRFVDRVLQIRGLLEAGLPIRIIKQILPCLDEPGAIHFDDATPQMLALIEAERDRLAARVECLTRNRDAIDEYLRQVRKRRSAGNVEEMRTDETPKAGGAVRRTASSGSPGLQAS